MTVASLPCPIEFPPVISGNIKFYNTGITPSMTNAITFDNSADAIALVHRVPKDGTLIAIRFRTGTVSTAGATFRASVQTVTGAPVSPSGSLAYTNGDGTVVVGTADDNVWETVAINGGTGVTVTRGDLVATVISVSTGTPNTVILQSGSVATMSVGNFPKLMSNTTGTWAVVTSSLCLGAVWEYSDGMAYCFGLNPTHGGATTNIGNGNERALRFQLPAPVRVYGVAAYLQNVAAGADFRVRIYDSTPTMLTGAEVNAGADVDGDIFAGTTVDGWSEFNFPSSVSLSANTTYYASIYQRTAANLGLGQINLSTSDFLKAMPGGAQCYLGTRSGGTGTFTDTTTTVPMIYLLIDGIDDGAGGGGGLAANPVRGFVA